MLLASCGTEIKFHKWPSGDYFGTFPIPEAGFYIPSISWCSQGELLATTVPSLGSPIVISVGQVIQTHQVIDVHNVQALTFSRTLRRNIVLGTESGHVLLYDVKKQAVLHKLPQLPSGVKYLQYAALDSSLAAGCKNGQICLFNSRNNVCATFYVPNSNSLSAMACHSKERHILAAASSDGILVVWDTTTGNTRFAEKTHTSPITDVAFSLGDDMATVGLDHKFNGYDLRTKECTFSSSADSQLSAVDFMPTGDKIAVASIDGKLYCYDRRQMSYPVHTIVAHHPKTIGRIAFQPLLFLEEVAMDDDAACEVHHKENSRTTVYHLHQNRAYSTILESIDSNSHPRSTIPTIIPDTSSGCQTPASGDYSAFVENADFVDNPNRVPVGLSCLAKYQQLPEKTGDKTPCGTSLPSQTQPNSLERLSIIKSPAITNISTRRLGVSPRASSARMEVDTTANVLEAAKDTLEAAKNDVVTSWIRKLPAGPPRSNGASTASDLECDVVQVGKDLMDVSRETVERLTEMINREFLRVRLAVSRGFVHMEYKMNSRWQDFNVELMKMAGYEVPSKEDVHEEVSKEVDDDSDVHSVLTPSRIPTRRSSPKQN